jgi:hypothetical protein
MMVEWNHFTSVMVTTNVVECTVFLSVQLGDGGVKWDVSLVFSSNIFRCPVFLPVWYVFSTNPGELVGTVSK